MKKYFITGLVLLLPITLTFIIVLFLFNLFTEPFVGFTSDVLRHYGLFSKESEDILIIVSRILILVLLFAFTVLLGILGRLVLLHYFIRFWEAIVARIPLVRSIYKTSQDVIKTIFTTENRSFKQVVLVHFPNDSTRCLGLITRDDIPDARNPGKFLTAVFVPTTPNPTSGFLVLFAPDEITHIDMSVEEALKYVISCGVIASPFKNVSQGEIP